MNLRDQLVSLPFVSVKDDGTLDLWSVNDTNNPERDYTNGRLRCALVIEIMRWNDAPHLLHHFLAARMASRGGDERTISAFMEELSRSIMAVSPEDLPVLSVPLPREVGPDCDPALVADLLPLTRRRECGALDVWNPTITGDYEQDCATGRHVGAVLAHITHRTRWRDFITNCMMRVCEAAGNVTDTAISVGADQVLASTAMASGDDVSRFRRAANALLEPEQPTEPVSTAPSTVWA